MAQEVTLTIRVDDQGTEVLRSFVQQTEEAFGRANVAVKNFNEEGKNTKSSMVEAAAGLYAVKTSLETIAGALEQVAGRFVRAAIEYGDSVAEMSEKSGISTEQLGKFKLSIEKAGGSLNTIMFAMRFLTRSMDESKKATSNAAQVYAELGVKTLDAAKKMRPAEEVILDVAEAFSKMKNGSEKTRAAIEIFGRGGMELIPMLNMGKKGLQENAEIAEKLGVVLSGKVANSFDDFKDKISELKNAGTGFGIALAQTVIPALTKFMNFGINIITHIKDWIKENQGLVSSISSIASVILSVLKPLTLLVVTMKSAQVAGSIFGGLFKNIGKEGSLIGTAVTAMKAAFTGATVTKKVPVAIPSVIETAEGSIGFTETAVASAGKSMMLLEQKAGVVRSSVSALTAGVGVLAKSFASIAIPGAIITLVTSVVAKITEAIAATKKWKEAMADISEEGKETKKTIYDIVKAYAENIKSRKLSATPGADEKDVTADAYDKAASAVERMTKNMGGDPKEFLKRMTSVDPKDVEQFKNVVNAIRAVEGKKAADELLAMRGAVMAVNYEREKSKTLADDLAKKEESMGATAITNSKDIAKEWIKKNEAQAISIAAHAEERNKLAALAGAFGGVGAVAATAYQAITDGVTKAIPNIEKMTKEEREAYKSTGVGTIGEFTESLDRNKTVLQMQMAAFEGSGTASEVYNRSVREVGDSIIANIEKNKSYLFIMNDAERAEYRRVKSTREMQKAQDEAAKSFTATAISAGTLAGKAAGVAEGYAESMAAGVDAKLWMDKNAEALKSLGEEYYTLGFKNIPAATKSLIDNATALVDAKTKLQSVTQAVIDQNKAIESSTYKWQQYNKNIVKDLEQSSRDTTDKIREIELEYDALNKTMEKQKGVTPDEVKAEATRLAGMSEYAKAQEEFANQTATQYDAIIQKEEALAKAIADSAKTKIKSIEDYYDSEEESWVHEIDMKRREIELAKQTASTLLEIKKAQTVEEANAAADAGLAVLKAQEMAGKALIQQAKGEAVNSVAQNSADQIKKVLENIDIINQKKVDVVTAIKNNELVGTAAVAAAGDKMAEITQKRIASMLSALSIVGRMLGDVFGQKAQDYETKASDTMTKASLEAEKNPAKAGEIMAKARAESAALKKKADRAEIGGQLASGLGTAAEGIGKGFTATDEQFAAWQKTQKGGTGTRLEMGLEAMGGAVAGQVGGALGGLISGKKNNLSGTGSSIGGALGGMLGPLGGIVGSALGGLVGGLFGSKPKKTEEQRLEEQYNKQVDEAKKSTSQYGKISDSTAKAIAEDRKSMSGAAAEAKNFASVINDVGVNQQNVNKLWQGASGIIDQYKKGTLSAKDAAKSAGESFNAMVQGARDLGTEGSKSMTDFIKSTKESGLKVKEVTEYINSQLGVSKKGTVTAAEGLLLMANRGMDAFKNLGELKKRMSELEAQGKKYSSEWNEINNKIGKFGKDGSMSMDQMIKDTKRLENQTLAVFNAMKENGASLPDIFDAIGPALDKIQERYDATKTTAGAAMSELMKVRSVTNANKDLFDAIQGNLGVLNALANTGSMTQATFTDNANAASDYYKQLTDAGLSGNQALGQMAPTLERLRFLAKEHGLTIDDTTKSLIKQAEEQGLLKAEELSMNDTMMAGFGEIIKALGGDVPDAMEKAMNKMRNLGKTTEEEGNKMVSSTQLTQEQLDALAASADAAGNTIDVRLKTAPGVVDEIGKAAYKAKEEMRGLEKSVYGSGVVSAIMKLGEVAPETFGKLNKDGKTAKITMTDLEKATMESQLSIQQSVAASADSMIGKMGELATVSQDAVGTLSRGFKGTGDNIRLAHKDLETLAETLGGMDGADIKITASGKPARGGSNTEEEIQADEGGMWQIGKSSQLFRAHFGETVKIGRGSDMAQSVDTKNMEDLLEKLIDAVQSTSVEIQPTVIPKEGENIINYITKRLQRGDIPIAGTAIVNK